MRINACANMSHVYPNSTNAAKHPIVASNGSKQEWKHMGPV